MRTILQQQIHLLTVIFGILLVIDQLYDIGAIFQILQHRQLHLIGPPDVVTAEQRIVPLLAVARLEIIREQLGGVSDFHLVVGGHEHPLQGKNLVLLVSKKFIIVYSSADLDHPVNIRVASFGDFPVNFDSVCAD